MPTSIGLVGLVGLVGLAFDVYWWLILAAVILSWIPSGPSEPAFLSAARGVVQALTEPYLGLFRRIIPPIGSGGVGIDISPIIAIFALSVIRWLVVRALLMLA